MQTALEPHPLVARMPPMTAAEFAAHKLSIAQGRQYAPIVIYEGKILDGWHRYRACQELKRKPIFEAFKGSTAEAIAFAIATFMHRNPTLDQRAMAAADIHANLVKVRATGRPKKQRTAALFSGKSSAEAGKAFGVSARTVELARQLAAQSAALAQDVREGKLRLSVARNRLRQQKQARALRMSAAAAPALPSSLEVRTGDALEELGKLPAKHARLIFTDPPYNIGQNYGDGGKGDRLSDTAFLVYHEEVIQQLRRVLADDGSLFLMMSSAYQDRFAMKLRAAGFHLRRVIVWRERFAQYQRDNFTDETRFILYATKDRTRFVWRPDEILVKSERELTYGDKRAAPAGRVPGNVWDESRICGTFDARIPAAAGGNCNQLPVGLVERCVRVASDRGDLVLDPFSGGATTGVACAQHGRAYLGIERNARTAEGSRRRLRLAARGEQRERSAVA